MLLAVWKALPGFRGAASLRTFVARIAHNRGVSHVARCAAEPRSMPIEAAADVSCGATPQEEAELGERRRRLLGAVQALPLQWRQPVTLTLEGFSPSEIAEVLGLTPNVISIRLTRARQALRRLMQETC